MSPRTPAEALASVTSALVQEHHPTDILVSLLHNAAAGLRADAVGLLVQTSSGALEPLSATSHRAAELEIYQSQLEEEPCLDSIRERRIVTVNSAAALTARWPRVGRLIVDAGYDAVHAHPLNWHSRALGGLNVFYAGSAPQDPQSLALGQAFADIATLVLVQTQAPSDRELDAHMREALDERIVVEQAKGVLAESHQIGLDAAYTLLLQVAVRESSSITQTARRVIQGAYA